MSKRLIIEDFIEKARSIHGDKYDYSKVEYVNNKTKVCIICPTHGEFWQTPKDHVQGKGCPKCQESHLEREIRKTLEENNIQFEYQKRFEWLGRQSLDFYLPEYNIAIECQGRQHFECVNNFGGEDEFLKIQERDHQKFSLCKENNVILKYFIKTIPSIVSSIYNEETIISDIQLFIKKIK